MTNLSQIKRSLMTYDEYMMTDISVPHFFKIKKSEQYLYYFGANHSHDPSDNQYTLIKKHWKDFVSKTNAKNSVVVIEGGLREVMKSEAEAIRRGAEANFITYLANKKGYKRICLEPGRQVEMKDLLKKYTKEEMQYYYFARVVNQWGGLPDKPKFEDYIKGFLVADKEESGWKDFDFSLENMKSIHKKLFKESFDERHTSFFYSIINPTFRSTRINAYSQDKGSTRDAYIVKAILEEWNKGNNLFIAFGYTHAIMHEPALKKLLK